MRESAADLARRLAQNAEAVCRVYLSNGCREGHTWRVGDADNTPGRSLAVRLTGPDSGKGAAGKWTDFATGEHGDLLDLIARSRRLDNFRDVAEEARRFLSLPETVPIQRRPPAPAGSPDAARRLFASARPIHGSIAETYLRNRGISELRGVAALRFHPNCFYRAREDAPRETWPALIAAITDLHGTVTGVLRTWLERDGSDKAPIATPRRAMGHLLGNGVRFGVGGPAPAQAGVVAAGEGLETMLSLRCVLPAMPMIAALSATHLATLVLPPGLRRLYVARDHDRVGRRAAEMLAARAGAGGVDALILTPLADDFNTDLIVPVAGRSQRLCVSSSRPRTSPAFWTTALTDRLVSDRRRQIRPRRRPRPAFNGAIGPEAAETRNGCARLSSPGGARVAPPFLAKQESRARRPPLRCGPAG